MTELKAAAIELALRKMFSPDGYFNVCTIRKLRDVTGVHIPTETMKCFELLHCVDWSDMPPETARMIAKTVVGILSQEPMLHGIRTDIMKGDMQCYN